MAEHTFRMPDVGEGIAEAEVVSWLVKPGDDVVTDQPIGEVMTDKATIELSSPVTGRVITLGAEPGDIVAVGATLLVFDVDDPGETVDELDDAGADAPGHVEETPPVDESPREVVASLQPRRERVLAAPSVRRRALDLGIDLHAVRGSGPAGRVVHADLEMPADASPPPVADVIETIRIVGLRRRIAAQMSTAASRIPHITYVEEVDVTELDRLRETLNHEGVALRLTLLPFLVSALVRAVGEQPDLNARFDDEAGVLHRHGAVHVGIATQTPRGLVVPVVRHAERLDVWDCAQRITGAVEAARDGSAAADDLRGSTITITSLGAMGGITTTPIINHPEVAIVGVNRIQVRPSWDGATFVPRKMMNLSSSFDHRIVDGWEAATFVQRIRGFLEQPATLFIGT